MSILKATPLLEEKVFHVLNEFPIHNNTSVNEDSIDSLPNPEFTNTFTYFSNNTYGDQWRNMSVTFGLIQVIILIMTSLIGSGANLLILVVMILSKKLHRLVNTFVFNQAFIDFVICAIFLPLHVAILSQNAPPPGSACDVIGGVAMWIHTASFLGLPAIAYSRYILHTQNKQHHAKFLGSGITTGTLLTIWLFPLLLVAPSFFSVFTFEYSYKARDCFIRLDKGVEYFLIVKSFILFVGPVFGIFFIYFRIYDFVKSNKSLADSLPAKRDVTVTRNLFAAFLISVVCLLPFNLAILSDRQGDVPSGLFRAAITLTWVSKATNPVLYMWRNLAFSKGLWSFVYRLMGREDLRRNVRVRAVSI